MQLDDYYAVISFITVSVIYTKAYIMFNAKLYAKLYATITGYSTEGKMECSGEVGILQRTPSMDATNSGHNALEWSRVIKSPP